MREILNELESILTDDDIVLKHIIASIKENNLSLKQITQRDFIAANQT